MFDETKKKEESYAMMGFSRYSGGDDTFFGSSIKQNGGIEMFVKEGDVTRGLNHDWYHGDKVLIRVRMTNSQFAEMITSMNIGEGVPVTLEEFNGKRFKSPSFENKRTVFEEDFKKEMAELTAKLRTFTEETKELLSAKKPPTKADKEKILNEISLFEQEISLNIPFIQKSFNEQMDKTVTEAKGEFDGFITSAVNKLGIQKLQEANDLKNLLTSSSFKKKTE